MKKSQAILILALIVTPALADTSPLSPLPPIPASRARANEGQNVTVTGIATAHRADTRLGFYIDLDGKGRSAPFAAFIPKGDEQQFPDLASLDGHRVEITGTVQFRNGIPIIIITDGTQLRVVG